MENLQHRIRPISFNLSTGVWLIGTLVGGNLLFTGVSILSIPTVIIQPNNSIFVRYSDLESHYFISENIKHTAWAPMPSFLPSQPIFSFVVAFMPIFASSIPSDVARTFFIAGI